MAATVKNKTWLNILLFVVTIFSVFAVGVTWSVSYLYAENSSLLSSLNLLSRRILENPRVLLLSALYTVVLMAILLGHELGHYITCRRYGLNATLPFFIPAPTMIGTLGAFIRIKSPIYRKSQLFDIGAAGPLVGFVLSLIPLVYGISASKLLPSLPKSESIVFGEPLLLKIVAAAVLPKVPQGYDIYLHPLAFAGWVGVLVTSFNLFPIGQLDGGHIAFAFFGGKSKIISKAVIAAFVVMGVIFWVGWLIWALVIMIMGLKHPPIVDEGESLSKKRRLLAAVVLVIFILSFIPDPVKGYDLLAVLKQFGL